MHPTGRLDCPAQCRPSASHADTCAVAAADTSSGAKCRCPTRQGTCATSRCARTVTRSHEATRLMTMTCCCVLRAALALPDGPLLCPTAGHLPVRGAPRGHLCHLHAPRCALLHAACYVCHGCCACVHRAAAVLFDYSLCTKRAPAMQTTLACSGTSRGWATAGPSTSAPTGRRSRCARRAAWGPALRACLRLDPSPRS